jgi:hypothetical protein
MEHLLRITMRWYKRSFVAIFLKVIFIEFEQNAHSYF